MHVVVDLRKYWACLREVLDQSDKATDDKCNDEIQDKQVDGYHNCLPQRLLPRHAIELVEVIGQHQWDGNASEFHHVWNHVVRLRYSPCEQHRHDGDDEELAVDIDLGDESLDIIETAHLAEGPLHGNHHQDVLEQDSIQDVIIQIIDQSFNLFPQYAQCGGRMPIGEMVVGLNGILDLFSMDYRVGRCSGELIDQHHEKNQDDSQYRQHLERREIGQVMAVQVVLNHVAGTPEQVSDGAEHGTVAQTPDVHEIQYQQFPVKTLPTGRHAALGAVATAIFGAAMLAHMLLVVAHYHVGPVMLLPLFNLLDPLLESAVQRVWVYRFWLLHAFGSLGFLPF